MSETTLKPIGAFSWNELMTTDVDAAKVFYGDLFGWVGTELSHDVLNPAHVPL